MIFHKIHPVSVPDAHKTPLHPVTLWASLWASQTLIRHLYTLWRCERPCERPRRSLWPCTPCDAVSVPVSVLDAPKVPKIALYEKIYEFMKKSVDKQCTSLYTLPCKLAYTVTYSVGDRHATLYLDNGRKWTTRHWQWCIVVDHSLKRLGANE